MPAIKPSFTRRTGEGPRKYQTNHELFVLGKPKDGNFSIIIYPEHILVGIR